MPFLFTNAIFLSALAGLAIPVVLHLLLKRKSPRLRFSTVRFFARQDEQATSKRKLRNLFLLSLRLLLFALLVLAFARPYLPFGLGPSGQPARQLILVIDTSASLQARDTAGPRWPRVQKVAQTLLAGLHPDDRAALVTCGEKAEVVSSFAPASMVGAKLALLQPTGGSADLAEGLRGAIRLAQVGELRQATTVAVISDLQRSSAPNLGSVTLPTNLELQWHPVGDIATPNLAVTELNLDPPNGGPPTATVASYSDEAAPSLRTELRIDGQSVSQGAQYLGVGAQTNLNLVFPALKPGWHSAEFEVTANDGFPLDDRRYEAFYVPEPIRVLLVEGRSGGRSFAEQTFFLDAALDPSAGTTNGAASRFALQKVGWEGIAAALLSDRAGQRPEVVMLPAGRQLPPEAGSALRNFATRGGGVLLFVGEETTANRFNADFAELSPVILRAGETTTDEDGWHLGGRETSATIFAPFRPVNSGNLALPTFTHRFGVSVENSGTVLAKFEDEVPLMVAKTLGNGRVLWVNTSADTAWTDWPKHKTYVPWAQQTAWYLSGRDVAGRLQAATNWVVGADGEWDLGHAAAGNSFRLRSPGGAESTVVADSRGRWSTNLAQPGIYSLFDSTGRERQRWAANIPAAESDLLAWRSAELAPQVNRVPTETGPSLAAGLFGTTRNQRDFWRVLLAAALVLLFLETFLSNRSHP